MLVGPRRVASSTCATGTLDIWPRRPVAGGQMLRVYLLWLSLANSAAWDISVHVRPYLTEARQMFSHLQGFRTSTAAPPRPCTGL